MVAKAENKVVVAKKPVDKAPATASDVAAKADKKVVVADKKPADKVAAKKPADKKIETAKKPVDKTPATADSDD